MRSVRAPWRLVAIAGLLLCVTGCGEAAAPSTDGGTPRPTGTIDTVAPEPAARVAAAEAAAAAFAAFALDDVRAVPWADSVRYTIADTQVARLDPVSADRPESWRGCPQPPFGQDGVYEGRDCPVSPLRTISIAEDVGEGLVTEAQAPRTMGCTTYRSPAESGTTTLWLRPGAGARDCFADFAVAVSVDASGRVTRVDLALTGP